MNPIKHGAVRKMHDETLAEYGTFYTKAGIQHRVMLGAVTQTVSERFCKTCGDWVVTKGIIGAMICPVCHTAWHEEL
jgi:hypothetical protein